MSFNQRQLYNNVTALFFFLQVSVMDTFDFVNINLLILLAYCIVKVLNTLFLLYSTFR